MAQNSGFFDSTYVVGEVEGFPRGDKAQDAAFMARFNKTFYTNGIARTSTEAFEVSADGQSGGVVNVNPGTCLIEGYIAYDDAVETLEIPFSTSDRSLVVVQRLDLTTAEDAAITKRIVERTDAPIRTETVYDIWLATLEVPGGTVNITQEMISDTRNDDALCGWVYAAMANSPDDLLPLYIRTGAARIATNSGGTGAAYTAEAESFDGTQNDLLIRFTPTVDCEASPTLQINDADAFQIVNSRGRNLSAGDLVGGVPVDLIFRNGMFYVSTGPAVLGISAGGTGATTSNGVLQNLGWPGDYQLFRYLGQALYDAQNNRYASRVLGTNWMGAPMLSEVDYGMSRVDWLATNASLSKATLVLGESVFPTAPNRNYQSGVVVGSEIGTAATNNAASYNAYLSVVGNHVAENAAYVRRLTAIGNYTANMFAKSVGGSLAWQGSVICIGDYAGTREDGTTTTTDSGVSICIGPYSRAINGIAIGYNANAEKGGVAINATTGTYDDVNLCNLFRGRNTYDRNHISIGNGADASTNADGNGNVSSSVAIGFSAKAPYGVCVALGANSTVTGANQNQIGGSGTTTYVYGSVQSRSDARDKADISDTELGLNFLNKLRPVQFRWDYREDYKENVEEEYEEEVTDPETGEIRKETKTRTKVVEHEKDGSKKRNRFHQGLIAQEVKAVMDEMGVDFAGYQDHSVNGGKDVLSIGYTEFIGPLIKAVQELSAENQILKTEIQSQRDSFESRLAKLEHALAKA